MGLILFDLLRVIDYFTTDVLGSRPRTPFFPSSSLCQKKISFEYQVDACCLDFEKNAILGWPPRLSS